MGRSYLSTHPGRIIFFFKKKTHAKLGVKFSIFVRRACALQIMLCSFCKSEPAAAGRWRGGAES